MAAFCFPYPYKVSNFRLPVIQEQSIARVRYGDYSIKWIAAGKCAQCSQNPSQGRGTYPSEASFGSEVRPRRFDFPDLNILSWASHGFRLQSSEMQRKAHNPYASISNSLHVGPLVIRNQRFSAAPSFFAANRVARVAGLCEQNCTLIPRKSCSNDRYDVCTFVVVKVVFEVELLTVELFPTCRKAMCPLGHLSNFLPWFLYPLRPAQRACRLGHVLMPFAWL